MTNTAQLTTQNPPARTNPCMPGSVRRLLERVKAQGYANLSVGPTTRQELRAHLQTLDAAMTPAPKEKTLARIATLMAHYWTPQMPANLQEAVALDWSEVLSGLPWPAVESAALEWLKTKERRPTPAQFRKMAQAFIDEHYGNRAVIETILRRDWSNIGAETKPEQSPEREAIELCLRNLRDNDIYAWRRVVYSPMFPDLMPRAVKAEADVPGAGLEVLLDAV